MEKPKRHIILVAGEASGDMHAAHLVEELKNLDPSITFSGIGGPKMMAAGVEIYEDLTPMAVIGFIEVIKHYPKIKKTFDLILDKVRQIKPSVVVLVDYPGFNLRLAAKVKEQGFKVIYYISPQVWAWKENRVHQIKKHVDQMLVLFPFERDFYARFDIEAQHVGHPLVDTVKAQYPKDEFRKIHGLSSEKLTIGILPGSRQNEIKNLLPVMLEAAEILSKEFANLQFLIMKAPTIAKADIECHIPQTLSSTRIIEEQTYDGINVCDLCMVASGTATLETAILQKPMVVVYKTSFVTWMLAKWFVKIPYIGLVNVVAGGKIVPECLQFQATGVQIAHELRDIFTDELKIAEIKINLKKIKDALGCGGSSRRAAQEILKTIAI